MSDIYRPLFGDAKGPWIKTFAWTPHFTVDAGMTWLRPIWKRHIHKHHWLDGGADWLVPVSAIFAMKRPVPQRDLFDRNSPQTPTRATVFAPIRQERESAKPPAEDPSRFDLPDDYGTETDWTPRPTPPELWIELVDGVKP